MLPSDYDFLLLHGDCLSVLKNFQSDSVDSIVQDPPGGAHFMGYAWDSNKGGRTQWIAWFTSVMEECLRVLKPGGFALVWSFPRTQHYTMTAIEDAGFEIKDIISTVSSQNFPKSKTSLKGAHESWILAKKKGKSVLNINTCRIGDEVLPEQKAGQARIGTFERENMVTPERVGRYPTNLIFCHDDNCTEDLCIEDCPIRNLDSQTGNRNVSRFFYTLKATSKEKDMGLSEGENVHATVKSIALMRYLLRLITPENGIVLDCFMGSGSTGCAAMLENRKFLGIEMDSNYVEIARRRITYWKSVKEA